MPDAGYDMDGFGGGYATPEGRRAEILSRRANSLDGVYVDPSLMSDEEIASALEENYRSNLAGWKNPEEYAEARQEYALDVPPDARAEEIEQRYRDSARILDPISRRAKRDAVDAEFLRSLIASKNTPAPTPPANGLDALTYDGAQRGKYATDKRAQSLTDSYEDDVASPLAPRRQGDEFDSLVDPETNVGWFMSRANVFPEAHKIYLGGESDSYYDALGQAVGNDTANRATRWMTENPVANLPDDATEDEVRQAVESMRYDQQLAQAPRGYERWKRTTGIDAPPALSFASDLSLDMLDASAVPSYLMPGAAFAKNLISAPSRAAAKGTLLGGLRSGSRAAASDAAFEAGIMAGMTPPEAYSDKFVKDDEQLEHAKRARGRNETVRLHPAVEESANVVRQEAARRRPTGIQKYR